MQSNKQPISLFIDFEAITNNFLNIIQNFKSKEPIIYAFTVGKYAKPKTLGQKPTFITQHVLITWETFSYVSYKNILRKKLLTTIASLTGLKESEINPTTVIFYGWNAQLENKITSMLLKIPTHSITDQTSRIGLDVLVENIGYKNPDYFKVITSFLKNPNRPFGNAIELDLERHGLIASYLGFIIFGYHNQHFFDIKNNPKTKDIANFFAQLTYDDILVFKNIIAKYNSDDVHKLAYIVENYEAAKSEIKKLIQAFATQDKLRINIIKAQQILDNLKYSCKEQNTVLISDFLDKSNQSITKLSLEIEELKSSFKANPEQIMYPTITQKTKTLAMNKKLHSMMSANKNLKTVDQFVSKIEKQLAEDQANYDFIKVHKRLPSFTKKPKNPKRKLMAK